MIAEYKESIDICSDLQTIHERVSEVSIKSALDLTNHSLTNDIIQMLQNSEEYLSIIKKLHSRLTDEADSPPIEPSLLQTIDQATLKLKTAKDQIEIYSQQLRELQSLRVAHKDVQSAQHNLQKMLSQKQDEIIILRQTIKTLYADNQRFSDEKVSLGKQLNTLKEQNSALKKRIKRQEQEMNEHRVELKKMTSMAEERLAEYAREEEERIKQIKQLNAKVDKLKSEMGKKDKQISVLTRKAEEAMTAEAMHESNVQTIQTLHSENKRLKSEIQIMSEKSYSEKSALLAENAQLLKQIQQQNDRADKLSLAKKQFQLSQQHLQEQVNHLEAEVVMRTEKLKEKTKQLRVYNEQSAKLVKKVEQLSAMSEELMSENRQLTNKCMSMEENMQDFRNFQGSVARIKGDMNIKKSMQLGRLLEGIGKLQMHA